MLTNNKQKALTIVEMIVLIVIIVVVIVFLPLLEQSRRTRPRGFRCKSNLKQIGTSMATYVQDFGYNVRYPDTNGGGFIARLYQEKILMEPKVYLCPFTEDQNDNAKLWDLIAEDKDSINAISYAGRMNKKQTRYPGLYRVHSEMSGLTSLASDDFQGTPNHENGKVVVVLYLDGHVDAHRDVATIAREDTISYITAPLTN